MREASRDKATPLEEGGRKDNLDRCQPPFGKVRGVANRSDCLDGSDWALAHSLNDDHSQTAWVEDALSTRHRNRQDQTLCPTFLRDGILPYPHGAIRAGDQCVLYLCQKGIHP